MCLPELTVVGSLMSAASNVAGAQAQSNAYKAQAQTARNNSLLAQAQAASVAQQGAQEEQALHNKGKQVAGAQEAGFGASGIDSGSGSALDILNNTSRGNTLDVLNARRTTANQTYGLQEQASDFNTQAKNYDSAASNAKTMGYISAAGSILNGVTSLNSQNLQRQAVGLAAAKNTALGSSAASSASFFPMPQQYTFNNPLKPKQKTFF